MLNGRARMASSKAASAASHCFRSMKIRAGRRIGSEEDRVESLFGPRVRWASQPHQVFAALQPGRVVKDLDQALLLVEPQPSNHLNPGGHALQLIWQIRGNEKEA